MAVWWRSMLIVALLGLSACSYRESSAGASVKTILPWKSVKKPLLPPGSQLIEVDGDLLHVRIMGGRHEGPTVVMLSGPTDSWHSDSAWFAALQPLLARTMRTYVVDRAGQGFSEGDGRGGYAAFGEQLGSLLPELASERVIVVAFASANLSLFHYFAAHPDGGHIAAVLLIDPDALHPKLIEFYASQAEPFKDEQLRSYVRSGKYDERALKLHDDDREHVESLLSEESRFFFAERYFERVMETRLDHTKILARFREIARYDEDVYAAASVVWPEAVPVWSFDTAFELDAVVGAEDDAERQRYRQWHDLSSEWMQSLPGGCRIVSESREHLAVVEQAETLVDVVARMAAGEECFVPG
jgi:pimeloyl-ACP methyl ester carboxylesterase